MLFNAASMLQLVLTLSAAPRQVAPVLITFKPDAVTATALGTVEKRNTFVFYAVKGELLIVNIIPISKGLATSGMLSYPSGKETGNHGGIIDSEVLTETGKFKVVVGLNTMAETLSHGKFRLELVRFPGSLIQGAGH